MIFNDILFSSIDNKLKQLSLSKSSGESSFCFTFDDFNPLPPIFLPALFKLIIPPKRPHYLTLNPKIEPLYLLLLPESGSLMLSCEDAYGKIIDSELLCNSGLCFLSFSGLSSGKLLIQAADRNSSCHLMFLYGSGVDYYFQLFCLQNIKKSENINALSSAIQKGVADLPETSSLLLNLTELEQLLPAIKDNPILLQQRLTEFFTLFFRENEKKERQVVFHPYLSSIRRFFHEQYVSPCSLDDLEDMYKVNKFRIVREFTAAFGCSPIAYLNNCRLEKATELLLSTDKRINEVGSMVGIDNTNHFIKLFAKKYNATPGVWRKQQRSLSLQEFHPQ